jgi:endo-1,4-beta-mannosidase
VPQGSVALTHSQAFVLGVNYWPRAKAMGWWQDFDAGEVREEFAMVRELGLAYVRIFLLWESFQPTPTAVSSAALARLRTVCDVAFDLGLRLQPTFFIGHMSGPNWAPEWLLARRRALSAGELQVVGLHARDGHRHTIRNPYTDKDVIAAEDLRLHVVCNELRDHPAIWSWSLGNEPDLFARPPSTLAGRRWVADRVRTIRAAGDDRPVLIGLHNASVHADTGLRIDHVAAETDISVMHGYSTYDPLARNPLDPDLVPFLAAVTSTLAGRPVLFEEFGVNTQEMDGPSHWEQLRRWDGGTRRAYFASQEDAASYATAVLERLHRIGCLGAMSWCFGDYLPALWDRPPCDLQRHERFFGLFRADGSLKPIGRALADFAAGRPIVREPERQVELPVGPDDYYREPGRFLEAMYEEFGRM